MYGETNKIWEVRQWSLRLSAVITKSPSPRRAWIEIFAQGSGTTRTIVALPTVIYILHRRRKFINRILSWTYPLSDILPFAHNILSNA